MKTFKLHLIRHGMTAGNLQGLYIGSGTDIPLCDEGRAQLKELKERFEYPQVDTVFSSPLVRAVETANILFPNAGHQFTVHTLHLSRDIYHGTSIASLAVAAHECGHALQHQEGYRPLTFRNAIVPVCNFSYNLGWVAIMIGLFMGRTSIAWIGVLLTSLMLLFQIVTLPVEFDASSRALSILNDRYLVQDEYFGAKKMLTAAALTYVAGMLSTLLSLLRIVLVVLGNDRGRD